MSHIQRSLDTQKCHGFRLIYPISNTFCEKKTNAKNSLTYFTTDNTPLPAFIHFVKGGYMVNKLIIKSVRNGLTMILSAITCTYYLVKKKNLIVRLYNCKSE